MEIPIDRKSSPAASSGLPHRTLRGLDTKHGDFMCLQLAQVSTVVASSPEMAKEIMKTHDIVFANRPFLVVAMTTTYECTDIISAENLHIGASKCSSVASFQSIREEEVLNLVKTIKSNEGLAVNLTDKVFSISYAITARAAFGKTCKDQEVFISVVAEETKVNSGSFVSEFFPSLKFLDVVSGLKHRVEKIHGEADRIVGDIVNDHKESRAKGRSEDEDQEDLVDDGEFPLTDNNIKAILFDIFIGGSETLATAIEWAMSEMIKNPRVMKKAQAECIHTRSIFPCQDTPAARIRYSASLNVPRKLSVVMSTRLVDRRSLGKKKEGNAARYVTRSQAIKICF
ncbi:hypothetical protein GOBAR_DD19598 [Gossypium barbadense]|nr:hypothetical protein GOBAR_DD19598 [Gossypium barbadense]